LSINLVSHKKLIGKTSGIINFSGLNVFIKNKAPLFFNSSSQAKQKHIFQEFNSSIKKSTK